eukprot:scaffold13866_cov175-Amphora_coffeaeformis.AAC.1
MVPHKTNSASGASSRTRLLRLLLVSSLLTAAVVCAVLSYLRLSATEKDVGTYAYESIATSALQNARAITLRKVQGSQVMATLLSHTLPDADMWPMIDVPGYIPIASAVAAISESTTQSFMVFVEPEQAEAFEQHTAQVYQTQGRPSQAGVQDFGFGIWKNDPESGSRLHDVSGETNWGGTAGILAPLMMHNLPDASSLLYNVYSEANRGIHIDSMMECIKNNPDPTVATSCSTITDMLELKLRPGPAGLLFQPVVPANNPNQFVGFATTSIHWQEVLTAVVPDYVNGLVCVVSTDTASYTYEIRDGYPELVGPDDQHDTKYEAFARSVVLTDFLETSASTSATYTLTVYPTSEMFNTFTTSSPLFVSVGFFAVICVCAALFGVYDYLMRHEAHERKLVLDMKRRFVRFISHEIRTPLNTVCMGLDLLASELRNKMKKTDQSKDDEDFLQSVLVDVKDNANVAVSILSDLLDYDKLETGTFRVEMKQVRIWDLIRKTVNQFNVQAVNRKVCLVLCLDDPSSTQNKEDLEAGVHRYFDMLGDDVKISQIIRNLLSNALKFTPEGGSIKVKATQKKDGLRNAKIFAKNVAMPETGPRSGSIQISVMDSGVGLSSEQLDQLFNEGVQFDANKLQHGGGSGLGLNIAKGIVEQHGGTILAESEGLGKGTTFTVELPMFEFFSEIDVQGGPSDKMLEMTTCTTSSLTDPSDNADGDFQPRHILVVEDSDSSRKMLIRLLERSGHSCIPAANGQDAREIVRSDMQDAQKSADNHTPIDTILMDFEMPLLRGPDATKQIRQLGFIGTILGVTGNVLSEDIDFFIESGADEVLPKPISMKCLQECWNRHPSTLAQRSMGLIRRNKWSFSRQGED